jgi:hypothetical protein
MASLIYNELNRIFYYKYIHVLDKNDENKMIPDYAVKIATGYLEYMKDLKDNCEDENIKYAVNYWFVMKVFIMYMRSQENGDMLTMEKIENNFCGVFLLLDKRELL